MSSTLALVMIVKDEAASLERCLASAIGTVDETIVLDTGSTDATVDIARRMGATVHHFAWCDDFSAARNAALDFSNANWNLILDADEWIVSGQDELRKLKAGDFIGQIAVASLFDNTGTESMSTEWISRLLPRGVRYTGRIHEQPSHPILPRRRIGLHVRHDGYLPYLLAAKQGRNQSLLKKALERTPADAYLLYQLGKDSAVYGQYNDAVGYFLKALALSSNLDSYRHDLVVRSLFALKKANMHERAIELASNELEHWQHSPDYFFCVADIFLEWAAIHPGEAETELLPIVESALLKCLGIGDQPMISGSVAGRGSYLAAHNLAVLYENTGRARDAAYYTALAVDMKKHQ